jgi:hypothetical protein
MSKNQSAGDANPVLYRNALKAFERYLDMELFHKGDKLFPELSLKVIERARQESRKDV